MREFLLAIMAGFVAAVVYQTYNQTGPAASAVLMRGVRQDLIAPPIGSTTLTRLPTFPGVAAEAGHGDAVLNANPGIDYSPAFGVNTNRTGSEWVGAGQPGSVPYIQTA